MRDIEALADGFSQLSIGSNDPDSSMYIGDLKDKVFENFIKIKVEDDGIPIRPYSGELTTYSEDTYIKAHLKDDIVFNATYEYLNDILNPEKTGENASINIETEGELIISGSVISSGGLNIASTGSLLDHSEYFDSIKGKTIASMLSSNEILQALNNGTIPEEMISLIK
jgi:hypothetical protein